MPEYLSPGVFVEEVPGRFKALEGVSTSTAAFVGPAERGTVAGFPLPFQPTGGFVLNPDPAPVFITSFAEFTRQFGYPLPLNVDSDPTDYGYLGHGVRAFFDNGGRRCYISRIVSGTASPQEMRSSHRLHQGVVYRLVRPVHAGDDTVFFRSLRNLNQGDTIEFRRRSDGSNALLTPATPATALGSLSLPLSLLDGDDFTVSTTNPVGLSSLTPIEASAQQVKTSAAPTFPLDATFEVRVNGGPIQPVSVLVPASANALDELTTQVATVLTGVQVFNDGTDLFIRTDRQGNSATVLIQNLSVATGTLAFTAPAYVGGVTPNVADASAVTLAELQALVPGGSTWSLSQDAGTGHLLITSSGSGTGTTIAVSGVAAELARFGLASPPPTITAGSGGGPAPMFTVSSYNTLANSVILTPAVGSDLDLNEVYAVETTAVPFDQEGPKFYARSPGSWSADVSVEIIPTDRGPVPITVAAAAIATEIEVKSTTSFYVGAIIEIDHNGQLRSYHEVIAIEGKKLKLSDAIGVPALVPAPAGDPPEAGDPFARVVEIDILIVDESGAAPVEIYRGLSWNNSPNATLTRHYATAINARSKLVYVRPPGTGTSLPSPPVDPFDATPGDELDFSADQQPTTVNGFGEKMSVIGLDGLPLQDGTGDAVYIGTDGGPGLRTGIESFRDLTEARIIAAPGRTTQATQLALISQCELLRYRFAVLDVPQNTTDVSQILAHRNLYDTSFAAYYAPWLGMNINGQTRWLPPSGAMAGIYARVDNRRGVWKAPANESPFNVIDLRANYTTGEQDILNPKGVNLIRRFDQGGIRVWGARTLSSDPEVKYINVRRTLIFLEATIDKNTQWVVFEPNTPATWATITASISAFLETQWREGALFGRSPQQAFFVRCDESTMSVDDIQNGRLICQIGVAIVRPAEFVIFRIEQITGFGQQ